MAGHPEILPERLFDLFSLSTLLILGFKFFLRGNHFWRVNYFKLKGKLYPVGDRRWTWTQCRCFGVYFVIFGRLQHVHLLYFLVKSVDDLSTTPISELIPLQQGVSPLPTFTPKRLRYICQRMCAENTFTALRMSLPQAVIKKGVIQDGGFEKIRKIKKRCKAISKQKHEENSRDKRMCESKWQELPCT